jgi:hypothetical protein
MGPLLWRDGYTLYFPGNPDKGIVPNYYESDLKATDEKTDTDTLGSVTEGQQSTLASPEIEPLKGDGKTAENDAQRADAKLAEKHQKELQALDSLPWAHLKRIYANPSSLFSPMVLPGASSTTSPRVWKISTAGPRSSITRSNIFGPPLRFALLWYVRSPHFGCLF